jgi:predicted site-specific integrase-resolvase
MPRTLAYLRVSTLKQDIENQTHEIESFCNRNQISVDYSKNRTTPHWAMTLIIIKDILCLFGCETQNGSAVIKESYAGPPDTSLRNH